MALIVLIEDETHLRENVQTILQLKGYTCITANNGAAGIELLSTINPDIILCDIMMPFVDGFGVLAFINSDERLKKIPFVFLTARADTIDRERAETMNAKSYLTKPFSMKDLIATIEALIDKPVL